MGCFEFAKADFLSVGLLLIVVAQVQILIVDLLELDKCYCWTAAGVRRLEGRLTTGV